MAPLYEWLTKKGMVIQKEEDELAAGRQGEKRQKVHGPAAAHMDSNNSNPQNFGRLSK